MRSLLDFIIKHSFVFLFILLETISLVLLFGFNDRQKVAFLSSANSLSGSLLSIRSDVGQYFRLRRDNTVLVEENATLRSLLNELMDSVYVDSASVLSTESVVAARVIDNSVRKDDNYMTIDKGQRDGIAVGMGVYDSKGVIGVVLASGKRYSLVLPVLNGNTSISCKVKGTGSFGFVEWDGGDPYRANVKDMPYHSPVNEGDTIVTTGFSSVFPEGIPIGTVYKVERLSNGYTLKVYIDLAVDMSRLGWVYVHKTVLDPEIEELYRQIPR